MKKIGFIDFNSKNSGDVYLFTGRNGRYELESSTEYSEDVTAALIGLTDVSEFHLSLPVELLNFRILKLPFSDRGKLLKVIPFELESLMMESSENVVFDAVVLGGSGDTFEVLVTYIEKGVFKDILMKLASLNIDPPVVTSIELQNIIRGERKDIAIRLTNPEKLSHEDRIDAARNEILSNTVNLRRGAFAYTKDVEETKRTIKMTFALFILLALAINIFLAFRIATTNNEASSLKRELRNIYTALFPGEKKVTDELYQMKSHMKELKEKGDALIGVYPLQFLLDISQKTVQEAAFNELSMDRDLITMKGEASSMADVDKMKAGLSKFLANVSVSDIKPLTSGKIFFAVVAKGRK